MSKSEEWGTSRTQATLRTKRAMSPLKRRADVCCVVPTELQARILAFAGYRAATRSARCSRAWRTAASAPALWLELAAARWPSTTALGSIVQARAREFYFDRAAAKKFLVEPYSAPRVLSSFSESDFLFTLDMVEHGRLLSSVVCEARDVLRHETERFASNVPVLGSALVFDGVTAKIDCTRDFFYRHHAHGGSGNSMAIRLKMCVVRKSDGRIAPFLTSTLLKVGSFLPFGEGTESRGPSLPLRRSRIFARIPSLSGALPFSSNDMETQLNLASSDRIEARIMIGSEPEFPRDMTNWAPSPNPSVLIAADHVEIRRVSMVIIRRKQIGLGADSTFETVGTPLTVLGIRKLLAQSLRFTRGTTKARR